MSAHTLGTQRRKIIAAGLFAILLLPSAYIAWNFRDMPQLGMPHDDTIYWVCARSLAQGSGYRILSLPDQPYQTKYPPLYPWLLSWIWRLNPSFPDNLKLATLLAWLFVPVYLLLARRTFALLGLASAQAWALTAVLAFNPWVISYQSLLMTEIPFSVFLLASLILARSADRPDAGNWRAAAAGLLGAAAYLVRTAALPLLVVVPLWFLVRGRRARAAFFFLAMLPAVLGWALWVKLHLTPRADLVSLYYTNYIGLHLVSFTWRDLPMLLWENSKGIILGIGGLFLFSIIHPVSGRAFWLVLAAMSLIGLARLGRNAGVALYHMFAAFYTGLLLVWHLTENDEFERLLIPLIPLLLAGISVAIVHLTHYLRNLITSVSLPRMLLGCSLSLVLAAFLTLIVLTTFSACAQYPSMLRDRHATLTKHRTYYQWITENVPAEAPMLGTDDTLTYLFTGRKGFLFLIPPRLLYVRDRKATQTWVYSLFDYARDYKTQYFVMDWNEKTGAEHRGVDISREVFVRQAYRYVKSVLVWRDPRLRLVHRSGNRFVFRVDAQ